MCSLFFSTPSSPKNEDPIREAEFNIRRFRKWWSLANSLDEQGLREMLEKQDTMSILELLEKQ